MTPSMNAPRSDDSCHGLNTSPSGFLLALGEVHGESPLLSLLHPRQEGAPVEAWVPPESSSARHWRHGPHGLRSPWAPEEEGEGQPAARTSWLPTSSGSLS